MEMTKVYDLPTRLFHWLFAGTFLGAFFIGEFIDDESAVFTYHMLLGLLLTGLVIWRLVWGLIGSRYARFSSFDLKPRSLFSYFKSILQGKSLTTIGHNPASSWAALLMLALAVGLGITGYLMTSSGSTEIWEDAHELMAKAFLIVAIAHVAGIVLYTFRHKDQIGLSMVHGKKRSIKGEEGIPHYHRGAAALLLSLVVAIVFHLYGNYDPLTRNLDLLGSTLHLGEAEESENNFEPGHDENDYEEDGD